MKREINVGGNHMGNIIKKNKPQFEESVFKGFDFLAMFDEQFAIEDFDKIIQSDKNETKEIITRAQTAVKNAYNESGDDFHYEVSMSDELKKAIESGEVSLVTGKDGLVYAQLRGEKGRFGKPLPIEKQLEEQGITAEQLQVALQIDAIREQLESMISALKNIEGRVTEIIQGQHNDRIGLFYSGLSLFSEANCISDTILKSQLFSQSLKALSDANSQVIQEIRSNIEYLATEQYRGSKDGIKKIEEKLASISKCYDVVYRSTFLKAAIYYKKREIRAMLMTIEEYGRFVQKLIIPYTGMLSELDKNEKFIGKGTWGKIANTLSICEYMRKELNSNEVLTLSMKGENDE